MSSQTNVTPRRTRDQPRPAHSANRAGGNFLPSRPPDSREGLHTGSGVRVESYEGGDSHPPAPAPAGLQELTTFHFLPSRRHPCRFCPYTPVSRCLRKQIPGASSEANPTISENAPLVPLPSPRWIPQAGVHRAYAEGVPHPSPQRPANPGRIWVTNQSEAPAARPRGLPEAEEDCGSQSRVWDGLFLVGAQVRATLGPWALGSQHARPGSSLLLAPRRPRARRGSPHRRCRGRRRSAQGHPDLVRCQRALSHGGGGQHLRREGRR